ncbi:hypothetical protein ACSTD6_22580, partial [Vibrio vulnificus]|uniref:hypothetical protein n=1 Tax=Vibrio vulnificus TaxID=672 RepID=UPI003ED8A5B5
VMYNSNKEKKMTWKNVNTECKWVFFETNSDDAHCIYFASYYGKAEITWESGEILYIAANEIIKREMESQGVMYDLDQYGDPEIGNVRIFIGSDGFCIPESCFLTIPSEVRLIDNPLKPLGS